jgi:peptidoglycan DL-endopeptidase CwlO
VSTSTFGGGLADIQARIAQLQSFAPPVPFAGGGSAGGSAFADALSSAVQQTSGADQATADPAAAQAPSSAELGEQAVSIAKDYLGVPYVWGGTDPKKGLDCSGLTQLVFKKLGIDLPRVSRDQAKVGTEVASLKDARPGDLLFFHDPVDHVAIYAGNGRMVEAPHRGAAVRVHAVWATPTHIRRVTGPDQTASTGTGGISAAALQALGGAQGLASLISSGQLPDGLSLSGLTGLTSASSTTGTTGTTGTSAPMGTPYDALFVRAGRKHGVDPALLAAVAKAESGFRPDATSPAGARGLMQLMPATARGLGVDPLDPAQAVDGAARLLAGYLKDYDGRTDLALAAYNAGPGAVRRYGGVPPYDETRTYVQRVTRFREDLR